MRCKLSTLKMLTAIFLALTYLGCGGGGGGGSDGDGGGGGGSSGISYSGLTTQAEVDENNATDLAGGAFAAGQAGSVSSGFPELKAIEYQDELQIDTFRTLKMPSVFGDCIRSIDLAPPLYKLSFKANDTHTETGTEAGPCGGSFSYTIRVNETTGKFSGSFTFSKYCDQGITISGQTSVRGTLEPLTGDIITATFSFENLSDETMIMDGEMSVDFSVSPINCTIDGYFKDKATGLVYWIEDYHVNITEHFGYDEVDIMGTFYHPDCGYVVVSCPEFDHFIIYEGDDWPSSGILLIEGIRHTNAMLTAIDNEVCRVEGDTNGDGHNDCDSGILNWTDYESIDDIEFTGSHLLYRTYSDSARNQYRGWVEFLNHGQPIIESEIEKVVLKDENEKEVPIVLGDFDDGEFYSGSWNDDTDQVDFSGPHIYTGFGIEFPEGVTLNNDQYYTYEATTSQGNKLTQTQYFPGKLELMVVDSASMSSHWVDNDLNLTWANPDLGDADQVNVWLFSEENGFELYLGISLPKTAIEVTIPEEWVNNVKQLSNSNVMSWMVQLRAFNDITNNKFARSYSDGKIIDRWSD